MTVPLLHYSSDIVEVIVPATIALAGLVYLASQPRETVSRGFWVATAAITFGALLYQGIILASALVPSALPRGASVRMRAIALCCVIVAMAPLVIVTTTIASGTSPSTAIHLMLTGEGNLLYRNSMAAHRLSIRYRPLAAISLGAARSIVEIPDSRGISGSLRLLSHRATFLHGATGLGGCLVALTLVVAGAVVVVWRRDWRIAVAFAGSLILPVVRSYTYLKFYILMPIVVALVAAVSPPAIVLGAAAIVGSFNLTYLMRDIAETANSRATLRRCTRPQALRMLADDRMGAADLRMAGFDMLDESRADGRRTPTRSHAMIDGEQRGMVESFRSCFCDSSAVYTDDVTESSKEAVIALAKYYRFAGTI